MSETSVPAQALVDSNVLIALVDERDVWHAAAQQLLLSDSVRAMRLVYLDCVVAESLSTLGRRLEEKKRSIEFAALIDRLFILAPLDELVWVFPEAQTFFTPALGLMRQTFGKLNFNDALIVAACRGLEINTLLSFDPDFDDITDLIRLK